MARRVQTYVRDISPRTQPSPFPDHGAICTTSQCAEGQIGVAPMRGSILVFDNGMGPVPTAGGFRVPLSLVILVFDGFLVAWDFLLASSHLRSGQRLGMGREGFRKHAIDLVGPAAVVLDNLIGDIRHKTPFGFVVGYSDARDKLQSHNF
jgi:hypothetical protein